VEYPETRYFLGEIGFTYKLDDPLFSKIDNSYEVNFLGLESLPEYISISGYTFSIFTDNPDHVGSFFFEVTGCDGEDVIIIYLKLDIALNTAPILEDWESLEVGEEVRYQVMSNSSYSQDLKI
jgi:hypothetical protein